MEPVGLGVRLPVDATPFIGRARELEQVAERLADPACRLLTVVGPGGIGKTRLAVEAARGQAARFRDGVVFVDLAAVGSPELAAGTLLRELGAPATGEAEAGPRLAAYLRPKRLLLVLDNFEHLLAAGGLLVDLLHAAPGLKLLVTSRARLNLAEEWLVPLEGMEAPPEMMPPGATRAEQLDLDAWDATRLFGTCVARLRPGWMPGQAEVEAVGAHLPPAGRQPAGHRAGRGLGAHAARWARSHSEVERSLAFLSTSLARCGSAPPQHGRGLRPFVGDARRAGTRHSAPVERLSRRVDCARRRLRWQAPSWPTWRGWWTSRGCAWPRAGATACTSWCASTARRSWRREHATESGESPDAVRRRHCAYYGRFLHTAMPKMNFAREALDELMAEFGNTEAGLRWAAQYHDLAALRDMSMSLFFIAEMLGWFQYIIQIFQTAIDLLEPEVDSRR